MKIVSKKSGLVIDTETVEMVCVVEETGDVVLILSNRKEFENKGEAIEVCRLGMCSELDCSDGGDKLTTEEGLEELGNEMAYRWNLQQKKQSQVN